MLWTIILFGSFLLNATLLFAFLKRPGLRTISNRFVMNLIASNLLTSLFLTPLLMLDAPPTSFGSSLCVISEGASSLVVASSILSVLLIAIDQYFAVVDPLRYRTRIDKLKCAVLIVSTWLVSIIAGLLAAFNPQPQSLWLSCRGYDTNIGKHNSDRNLSLVLNSTISFGNGTEGYNVEGDIKLTERNGSSTIEEELSFAENSTAFFGRTILESFGDSEVAVPATDLLDYITYGFTYASLYSVFVYLLPFIGVCWIYVSIYLAAHKNSERARRTGSGPILSSPSFCEEYGNVRQDFSNEDFRRIPKISSLSSIDESIETSPSQIPRRRSEMMLCSSPIEEEPSTGVVFTVGSQKVDVSPQKPYKIYQTPKELTSKVPISALKAEFLGKRDSESMIIDDKVRSKFLDRPDDRRKSSHDILCESMIRNNVGEFKIQDDSSDESSADEEEMLTFAKNHRLEDIEVAKCQNSIEDRTEFNDIPLREGGSDFSSSANKPNNFIDSNPNEQSSGVLTSPDVSRNGKNFSSKIMNTVQSSSNKVTPSGILSRAALENHNARSKLLNGRSAINGRYLNCGYNRSDVTMEHPELDVFQKCSSAAQNFSEAESSLLGTSAPVVTITPPNKIPLHRVSSIRSTSSYINSLKYRISNGSLFKYREETRAARISALVIVMGLICWTPYVVVLMIRNLPRNLFRYNDDISHRYDVMALSFLILAAYVSPLLFGYRSRRVKRELRKIFCFKKELSYKNNRSLMAKKVLKRRHSSNLSQIEMEPKYNILSCVYGRNRWPKEKVQFMQVPETALAVETCRSSFSSGASTQISTTSTEE